MNDVNIPFVVKLILEISSFGLAEQQWKRFKFGSRFTPKTVIFSKEKKRTMYGVTRSLAFVICASLRFYIILPIHDSIRTLLERTTFVPRRENTI